MALPHSAQLEIAHYAIDYLDSTVDEPSRAGALAHAQESLGRELTREESAYLVEVYERESKF